LKVFEMSLSLTDIRAAAAQIKGRMEETPCRLSKTLSEITGAEIYLKFENLQYTASFKDRGSLVKLLSLPDDERRNGVIAMSAGNHAQGVAHHASQLGVPATIVMPEGTPNIKIRQTELLGATVVVKGDTVDESADVARQLEKAGGLTFIHPFDDVDVIAGQGTVGLEMLEAVPDLNCLVVPVGGGGLISGMAIAAKALSPDIEVVGVETEVYPSVYNAFTGENQPIGGQTIADGIAVKKPGGLTVPIIRELVSDIITVPESEIENAINMLVAIEKTVVEGAGAVGLAAVLANRDKFAGRKVGLVLSGGNIDTRMLASILMRGLIREGRIARIRLEIPDRPGTLAEISAIIGKAGGNILEVQHQRMFIDVPAKLAELEFIIECRDDDHVACVIEQLRGADFAVMRYSN
jgi:threonine dehydratase